MKNIKIYLTAEGKKLATKGLAIPTKLEADNQTVATSFKRKVVKVKISSPLSSPWFNPSL
ncbi:hypothetical protein ACI2JA_03985 [Alkalihalobacillus sp. NPDC078783]